MACDIHGHYDLGLLHGVGRVVHRLDVHDRDLMSCEVLHAWVRRLEHLLCILSISWLLLCLRGFARCVVVFNHKTIFRAEEHLVLKSIGLHVTKEATCSH